MVIFIFCGVIWSCNSPIRCFYSIGEIFFKVVFSYWSWNLINTINFVLIHPLRKLEELLIDITTSLFSSFFQKHNACFSSFRSFRSFRNFIYSFNHYLLYIYMIDIIYIINLKKILFFYRFNF